GERGIRTLGRVSPTHAFQACSFNHSDISPCLSNQQFTGQWLSPKHQIVSEIVSDLLMACDHLRVFRHPFWPKAPRRSNRKHADTETPEVLDLTVAERPSARRPRLSRSQTRLLPP